VIILRVILPLADMLYGDEYFMRMALQEAQKAADHGEVPIGAVLVSGDLPIARCHNST
jgi:tRNA(adenine34) deaminase